MLLTLGKCCSNCLQNSALVIPPPLYASNASYRSSDEFIPPIVDLEQLDEVVSVDDGDSIIMAQKFAADLGVGVGISSGANLLGALLVQEELGPDAVVATVFSDDNKKYLSTDLFGDEPIRDDFLSPEVELLSYDTLRRSCRTCSDLEECQHWVNHEFDFDD